MELDLNLDKKIIKDLLNVLPSLIKHIKLEMLKNLMIWKKIIIGDLEVQLTNRKLKINIEYILAILTQIIKIHFNGG